MKAKKAAKKSSKPAAKKAKKAAPAKAAKKKSPAKKAAPKKAAKKAPAKKAAKPAIKKPAAKKAAAKKTPAKKALAKKQAAPKAAAKKVAVKKAAAPKAAVQKRVAKKAPAPKAAPRKTAAKPAPQKLIPPAPQKPHYSGASAELVNAILATLDDAKAENTVAINLEGRSTMADAMVVTTGRVNRHVAAIADQVIGKMKDHGVKNLRVEGLEAGDWCLVDTGDVIIHIFRPEVRAFYNLEKLWSLDAPKEQN